MNNICYKVVAIDTTPEGVVSRHSYLWHRFIYVFGTKWVRDYKGKLFVTYTPDVPTVPLIEDSKLMAFDSLVNARNFMSGMNEPLEVWECECLNPQPLSTVLFWNELCNYEAPFIRGFWKNQTSAFLTETPKGTIACDSITLKKLMPNNKTYESRNRRNYNPSQNHGQ